MTTGPSFGRISAIWFGRNRVGKAAIADWDAYDAEVIDYEAEKAKKAVKAKKPVPANQNGFWTPERIKVLTTLWNDGVFALDIAKVIGCTKNAVIGKANRINLQPRDLRLYRRVVKHGKGRKLKSIGRGKGRPS